MAADLRRHGLVRDQDRERRFGRMDPAEQIFDAECRIDIFASTAGARVGRVDAAQTLISADCRRIVEARETQISRSSSGAVGLSEPDALLAARSAVRASMAATCTSRFSWASARDTTV